MSATEADPSQPASKVGLHAVSHVLCNFLCMEHADYSDYTAADSQYEMLQIIMCCTTPCLGKNFAAAAPPQYGKVPSMHSPTRDAVSRKLKTKFITVTAAQKFAAVGKDVNSANEMSNIQSV